VREVLKRFLMEEKAQSVRDYVLVGGVIIAGSAIILLLSKVMTK
jgi:hypothetical protein